MNTLKQIYNNLQNDYEYGNMKYNCEYPYFDTVLCKDDNNYICW